jgi:hypothetical protein
MPCDKIATIIARKIAKKKAQGLFWAFRGPLKE